MTALTMCAKDLDSIRYSIDFICIIEEKKLLTFMYSFQPEIFGLRYVSQKSYPRVRWVELDRPLKKQLDKYAQESYLYLRIMYYVNDVSLLQDEMTRFI